MRFGTENTSKVDLKIDFCTFWDAKVCENTFFDKKLKILLQINATKLLDTMYSDVYPKSFLKSSPEENAGRGLNPPTCKPPLIFQRGSWKGPFGGPLGPRGSRVSSDVVEYNKT